MTSKKRKNDTDVLHAKKIKYNHMVSESVQIQLAQIPKTILATILGHTGYKSMFKIKVVCKLFNKLTLTKIYNEIVLGDYCRDRCDQYQITDYHLVPSWFQASQSISWRDVYESKKISQPNSGKKFGTKILINDTFCEGLMINGEPDGRGVIYKKTVGLVYEGLIKNRMANGHGMEYIDSNTVYTGQFKNGLKHGLGTWKNNTVTWEGYWKNNLKHGPGKMIFANNDRIEANWIDDRINGWGIYWSGDCVKYKGYWYNDKFDGHGTSYDKNSIYTGQWARGKKNGYGKQIFTDGSYYIGKFMDNVYHGHGIYYYVNGNCYEGQWANGWANGKGKLYNKISDQISNVNTINNKLVLC